QDAARQAMARTERCVVVSASAPLELAVDRRKTPSSDTDPVVWAIGFRRVSDNTFAAAVLNYAMHPIALGAEERRISADWCGAASRKLSESLPGRPMVLVTNGA